MKGSSDGYQGCRRSHQRAAYPDRTAQPPLLSEMTHRKSAMPNMTLSFANCSVLEDQFPASALPDSPTRRVGAPPRENFSPGTASCSHAFPGKRPDRSGNRRFRRTGQEDSSPSPRRGDSSISANRRWTAWQWNSSMKTVYSLRRLHPGRRIHR